eukprot:3861094-Prymnesium_polylepis.1
MARLEQLLDAAHRAGRRARGQAVALLRRADGVRGRDSPAVRRADSRGESGARAEALLQRRSARAHGRDARGQRRRHTRAGDGAGLHACVCSTFSRRVIAFSMSDMRASDC